MKLIIDIDDNVYKDIQSKDWKNGKLIYSDEWKAIHNGTPLPKGHCDVFDKIRAEIMSKDGLEEALEIIDKYKAGSEDV